MARLNLSIKSVLCKVGKFFHLCTQISFSMKKAFVYNDYCLNQVYTNVFGGKKFE